VKTEREQRAENRRNTHGERERAYIGSAELSSGVLGCLVGQVVHLRLAEDDVRLGHGALEHLGLGHNEHDLQEPKWSRYTRFKPGNNHVGGTKIDHFPVTQSSTSTMTTTARTDFIGYNKGT
jgi:hypothetical protein